MLMSLHLIVLLQKEEVKRTLIIKELCILIRQLFKGSITPLLVGPGTPPPIILPGAQSLALEIEEPEQDYIGVKAVKITR